MRGNAELSAWGAEALRRRGGGDRRLRAHPRGRARGVRAGGAACTRCRPGVDVDAWVPQPRAEALAGLLAEAGAIRPNPGNAKERLADEGNAERLAAFLPGDAADGRLLRQADQNKGVQVLLDALRERGRRAVIVGFGALPRRARAAGRGLDVLFTGPLEHRHLVHLTALRRRGRRAVDLPRGVRHGRRRGRSGGLPARRGRTPLGPGRDRAGLDGGLPGGDGAGWRASPTAIAAALAERLNAILGLSGRERAALRAAARQAAVEPLELDSVAERILAASVGSAVATWASLPTPVRRRPVGRRAGPTCRICSTRS